MVKKIFQISDVHIMKLDRHEEYLRVFSEMYKVIKEIMSDENLDPSEVRVVVCGDIVHQKTNLSPELVRMLSSLFKILNSVGKTIILAGNHDFLANNRDRLDSLTPIIEIANYPNIFFADSILDYESGFIEDENICWAVYSIFDEFNTPKGLAEYKQQNPNNTIIGLFHGSIVGATTDNGNMMDNGLSGGEFSDCDVVMAGHIHKHQVIKKNGVRIVYGGSLIQQDFGENVSGHGIIAWDVPSLDFKLIEVPNDSSMYKIQISDISEIDNDTEKILNS